MPAVSGYQAGVESNDVLVSYALEATYGVVPAVAFQAVRLTGETLAGTKQRARPGELNTTGEVSAATTQQETAAGNLNFALSFGTYDDMLSAAARNDWTAAVSVAGVAGDISIGAVAAGSPRQITSGTAGKFTALIAGLTTGSWVRVSGFTQPSANGLFQVVGYNTTTLSISPASVATTAETPTGAAVVVKTGGRLTNSTPVKTLTLQKRLSPALFLQYPGSFVSAFTLTGGVGQFLSGSFTFMAKQELPATVDASTGAVLPAPTGRVHDTVNGFAGTYLNGVPVAAVVDSFNLSFTATGAKQEYGIGSAAAQGQIAGLLEVKGQLKIYFRDFTLYTLFKSETQGALTFVTRDPAGNAYAVTVLAATLMNPNVTAGGPSTPVMATFQIEGNPIPTGGTVQIDRLPL